MKKKEELIKKFEKEIENSKSGDILRNVFSALIGLTVIGSPIATLINSFIPSRRFLRLETFIKEISEELKKHEENLNLKYISSDEFAYIFERCFVSASDNYQKSKLDAFKAILVNSVLPNSIEQEQKEFYLNLTNQLTTIHLKALRFCYDTEEYIGLINLSKNEIKGNIESSLKTIFKEYDFETIRMTFNDLKGMGLINLDSSSFQTMTVNQGMDLIGSSRTTDSGNKYMSFITL